MQTIVQRQSDMVLVERYQFNGDELAFAELTRRYADHVYSTCLRILGDPALAEDATQETFFKLFKQPRQVRESIGGWLHRVATRLAIDRIRHDTRRRAREQEYTRLDAARRGDAAVESWDALAPHVDAALDDLPRDARDILIAHFLHDRTLTDLAREQHVSKATMSRRCRDALEKLRAQLVKRGVVAGAAALGGLLTAHTVEAAPQAVVLSLRKMALAGSTAPVAAGAGAASSPCGGQGAWVILLLIAGVAAACAMLVLTARYAVPPRPTEQIVASPAPAAAIAVTTPAPSYLVLPGAEGTLRSDVVTLMQHPDSAIGGHVSVVFGDGRTVTMSVAEVRALVEQQTGRPFADLLPTLRTAAP